MVKKVTEGYVTRDGKFFEDRIAAERDEEGCALDAVMLKADIYPRGSTAWRVELKEALLQAGFKYEPKEEGPL